jgi:cytidylate kinase
MQNLTFNGLDVEAHLVDKQLRLWNARCRAANEKTNSEPGFRFLTIAKDEGSLGNEVAQELSRRMGWHVFDEEIIHYIAQNSHVSEKLVRQLDQKSQSGIQETIERFLKSIEKESFGGDEYHEALLVTLMCLAKHGAAILVGRGANFALYDEPHGLKVHLTASPEVRVRRLAERWKVTEDEARHRMQVNDGEKKKFIRHYYWRDYDDMRFYDVTYNTDRTSADRIASSIQAFMNHPDDVMVI